MAVLQGNAKQGSTRGFYPKTIEGSLRFNDDDSAYLSWTPDSAGNRKTWTLSCWVKKCSNGGPSQTLLKVETINGNTYTGVYFVSDKLYVDSYGGSTALQARAYTNAVFRDPSAWYHVVAVLNTPSSTASDRAIIYVNGVRQDVTISDGFDQNADLLINTTSEHRIGAHPLGDEGYLNGYLAEYFFIDGTAHDADAFGETKNGVWVPKNITATDFTMGTNGFHLTFQDDTEVEAFNTVLYQGNNGVQSVTGMGFSPDLLWVKRRTGGTSDHQLYDQVRGASNSLESSTTDAEANVSTMASFSSDGFNLNGANTGLNNSGSTYVAWGWKAGDSNVSNTDGSITSTVRANDTYGFSIVSWTDPNNSSKYQVGHGLGQTPSLIIVKDRSNAGSNWLVSHSSLSSTTEHYVLLNQTDAQASFSEFWGDGPDSDSFGLKSGISLVGGANCVAYCWAEKSGYSKFSSYEGTGVSGNSVTGLGFAPAWIMIKNVDDTGGAQWMIYDNTRSVTNPNNAYLQAESTNAESAIGTNEISFDSDGFTVNSTTDRLNRNGDTMIYAAFADTREAAFWLDQSGNDNDWQPVNLDHNDTVADSPTDNFATLNPLDTSTTKPTFYNGNLEIDRGGSGDYGQAYSTIQVESGKWYAEATGSTRARMGIITGTTNAGSNRYFGEDSFTYGYASDGRKVNNATFSSYGSSYTNADTIGIALDADAGTITFYKNGVSQGTAFSGLSGPYRFGGAVELSEKLTYNFGQQPFKYDPPA